MPIKALAFLSCFSIVAQFVQAEATPPAWVTEGPKLENDTSAFEVPVEVLGTKMYLEVEVGGQPRRFVFDTGSPSMIDMTLAKELGLQTVGSNQGLDAHGNIIETKVVQADMVIGGAAIHGVSMMAADFSGSVPTQTFIGDGVIGSDLLPLGAWQLDLRSKVIRFHTSLKAMPHIKHAKRLKMYQFGYPFMPLFNVQVAKQAKSKAMLDTGSPNLFAISPPDLNGAERNSGTGKIHKGFGSPGASLGGQAPDQELLKVELRNLSIDRLELGTVVATTRNLSPSLIGADILNRYIITLHAQKERAYFYEYREPIEPSKSFGFSLGFDGEISVAAVWDNSPASEAGLTPGLPVTAINDSPVSYTKQGLVNAIEAMQGETIKLTWAEGSVTLTKSHTK